MRDPPNDAVVTHRVEKLLRGAAREHALGDAAQKLLSKLLRVLQRQHGQKQHDKRQHGENGGDDADGFVLAKTACSVHVSFPSDIILVTRTAQAGS